MNLVACCLVATLALQVEAAPNCDLKTIFRTPNTRRNYDQFEILERSNFDSSSETIAKDNSNNGENSGKNSNNPNSFANAQVLLRFGSDSNERRPPSCCNQCQCPPYYYPAPFPQCYYMPSPYYYPFYYYSNQLAQAETKPLPISTTPTLKSEVMSDKLSSVKSVYEESTPSFITSTQPEEMQTNKLLEKAVRLTSTTFDDGFDDFSSTDGTTPTIFTETTEQATPLSSNVQAITVDLSKVKKVERPAPSSGQKALNDALMPYTSPFTGPTRQQPKNLVTYPIFNKPSKSNLVQQQDGEFSRVMLPLPGSGYYSGVQQQQQQGVFYRRPPVLSLVREPAALPVYYPEQMLLPEYRRGSSRYVCMPVPSLSSGSFYGRSARGEQVVVEHREEDEEQDCCCPGCRAKYVGELNEMGL